MTTQRILRTTLREKKHVGIVYDGSGSHLVFEKISIDQLLKR